MTLDEIADAVLTDWRVNATPLVIIVGGPGTGKSSFAHRLVGPHHHRVRSTDELVGVLEWSEASEAVAGWFDEPGEWIIEGVATVRALRKWLRANPDRPLKALVVLMAKPLVEQTKQQSALGKGVATVWSEIAVDVLKRGARILKHDGNPQADASSAPGAAAHQAAAPRAHAPAPAGG